MDIKRTVDSLDVVATPMSIDIHINMIFYGLSSDFHPFIASIMSRKDLYIVVEIEALILVQEECIERNYQINHLHLLATVIVASWTPAYIPIKTSPSESSLVLVEDVVSVGTN